MKTQAQIDEAVELLRFNMEHWPATSREASAMLGGIRWVLGDDTPADVLLGRLSEMRDRERNGASASRN